MLKDILNLVLSAVGLVIGITLLFLTLPDMLEKLEKKECDCEARSHGCTGNDKTCAYNGYYRKHDPCYKCPNNPSEKCKDCPTRIEYRVRTEKEYIPPKLEINGDDCASCEERFSCTGECKYLKEE